MDERWVAWLAGIVDGEGTIAISRSRRQHGYRGGIHHRTLVQVANTDARLLEKTCEVIESITGKHPRMHPVTRYKANQKQGWMIQVTTCWEVGFLIPAILPFLVSKSEQAHIVLEFSKRHIRSGTGGRRSDECMRLDEIDYAKCRLLNQRGNHGGPPIEELEAMLKLECPEFSTKEG